MKIALVSPYDFSHMGGVVNHITNLYHCLARMGYEVKVIAPTSKTVTTVGNDFVHIGTPWPLPASESIIRVPLSLSLGGEIKEVLAREKFDIIHLHEPFVPMLCSAVLRFSDTINVGTFHAAEGRPGYNFGWPVSRYMLRKRRLKLHGRIAVSRVAYEYARKYVPGDYTIIPNGTNLTQFHPDLKPMEKYCDGKLNILFVSRLEPRKGVDYLLPAFSEVKRQVPNSRLLIVGAGTRLRKGYEEWVKRAELQNDVIFAGFASDADLPRYFRTADVFCVPATGRESQGIILLEAMATGRPIVATNISGYATVVTHGEEGLLVPPRDSRSLAKALVSLLNNESLRRQMGAKGLARARDFSWEKISQKVVAFYLQTLEKYGQSPSTQPKKEISKNISNGTVRIA
jgi:phosphatidyl-myo-inositol alpha-mannosyltransferase